ncbi:MAG TPA: NAD-dependent epimerase/dehydratase family protein, partial [Vicinamibacterales bacterium]|nr:NAD-dependent epimerase/dehydratase family protein [Vicinamibacterales bacterium]
MSSGVVVVCGGGGFIGGHLVRELLSHCAAVRAVDIKPMSEWCQVHVQAENLLLDLRTHDGCVSAMAGGVSDVYNLACDMGGMRFIENNKALCMLSVLINTHVLMAARDAGARRVFFSSS